jgi:hypothetical protein
MVNLIQRHISVHHSVTVVEERDLQMPSETSSSVLIFVSSSIIVSHIVHGVYFLLEKFNFFFKFR